MQPFMRSLCALALVLVCLPALADDCPAIQALTATDAQTGSPVILTWSYSGGAPLSQTITGHDFDEPVVLAPGARQYVYRAPMPGEKHLQLTAVTACGTVTQSIKYHVKQCNIVPPQLTTSATRVDAGATFTASIGELAPGHSVLWEVVNGTTTSPLTGTSIDVTAANTAGFVTVRAWVSRGNSCSVRVQKSVQIVPPCAIAEPRIYAYPEVPTGNSYFSMYTELSGPGTLTYAVRNAEVIYMGGPYVDVITPATGSFEIDVIVSTPTCTRTFTKVYTVAPCEAAVNVIPGSGDATCGIRSVVAEFSGTGPWWGFWSDGEYFFTESPRLEKQVTTPGTYTISYFFDQICQGVVNGSVDAGPVGDAPALAVEPLVDGNWLGDLLCTGMPRSAQLTSAHDAGAQIVWSIDNGGTILGGQGTPQVQFAGGNEGPTGLTVTVTGTNGCPRSSTTWLHTLGTPNPTVSVAPSTIPAGGTAIVTVDLGGFFIGGYRVTSSLGDWISYNAEGQLEYRSTHGGGVATITLEAENLCGTKAIATTTLTIDGGTPATATATVINSGGTSCEHYNAYASFTGTAPFSGTWSSGETFVTNEVSTFLAPTQPGTYTLVEFRDANGPGTVSGSATFDFTALPAPTFTLSSNPACPNATMTATLTSPVPDGVTPVWSVWGANIVGGQGTSTLELQPTGATAGMGVTVRLTGNNICSPATSQNIPVIITAPQNPDFSTYPVEPGGYIEFIVTLDPNVATWGFENTLGDAMEIRHEYNAHTFLVRYTSTHGSGTGDVRIYGTTRCGATFETTKSIEILQPAPTVEAAVTEGEVCGAIITLSFTGTAPFTGTWADTGETFTTNESTITRFVTQSGAYTLSHFSDAVRSAGAPYIFVNVKYLPYAGVSGVTDICVGQDVTYDGPEVPAGWELLWTIDGENATIVSGQGTSQVVVKATAAGTFTLWNRFRAPEGCEGSGSGAMITAAACPTP